MKNFPQVINVEKIGLPAETNPAGRINLAFPGEKHLENFADIPRAIIKAVE
jgi:hypothetical protein